MKWWIKRRSLISGSLRNSILRVYMIQEEERMEISYKKFNDRKIRKMKHFLYIYI